MFKRIITYALLFLFLSCEACEDPVSSPDSKLSIKLSTSTSIAEVDDEVRVVLSIKNAVDLFALSSNIIYNSDILSVDSVVVNSIDGLFGDDVFSYNNIEKSGTLSISAGLTQTDGVDAVTGSGSICTLHFTAATSGVSAIEFDTDENDNLDIEMINENGENTTGFGNMDIIITSITVN